MLVESLVFNCHKTSVCKCDLWGLYLTPKTNKQAQLRGVEDIKWGVERGNPQQFPH